MRTAGLSDPWELELPHVRFSFEFDPQLRVEALLGLPDEERAVAMGRQVRLVPVEPYEAPEPRFLPLTETLALRNPPAIELALPLPADLAHAVELELEGAGRFRAGHLVVSGRENERGAVATLARRPLGLPEGVPVDAIDRPGRRRLRVILSADPHRGWADPGVRSLWPSTIETGWVEVEVARR